ncbi:MAG: hypothetical protein JKY93_13245, partial [Gammaproteobacteria bacterium]|nr:hypothetical protein [Gammaproteobacteria bacterium]
MILISLLFGIASTATAEIRQIRFDTDGEQGRIWIAFDQQPVAVRMSETHWGLIVDVAGVSSDGHTISPADRSLVLAMAINDTSHGARFEISAAQHWSSAHVELRRGGVLITVEISHEMVALGGQFTNASDAVRHA